MTTRVLQVFDSVADDTNFWACVAGEIDYRIANNRSSDVVICRYTYKYKSQRSQMFLTLHLVHFAARIMHLLYLLDQKEILVYFF